ncbi:uncharacterized protein LOC119101956, partial [Pollicipes pollicipes]|uniref:uncharacterized protein LOC119101956 n=1 Tax=Pollicipes pollicipes TaxID=41117 RepID=UPI00188493EF
MASTGGLLSPTLVKNAMRSFSADSLNVGGSAAAGAGGSAGAGWRPGPADTRSYVPLAATRVREVSRRRPRPAAGHQGSARPALDSEGDSDISSEGSSGASSLTRSQDSGAGAGRARLSESSEADNDDELANVNLRQLRSSYLTNFDSAKATARPVRRPDTGVSIKNLKNTYAAPPAAAARAGPTGEARPRDMSKITVNMASLKSVYSSPDGGPKPAGQKAAAAADLPAGLSLPSIRAAYVQQAQGHGQAGGAADRPAPRTIRTGVSIDKLRTSWNDLTQAGERPGGDPFSQSDSLKSACMGVSVKALRASYGDLSRLSDAPAPEPTLRPAAPRPAPRCNSIRDLSSSAVDLPGLQASPVPRSWLQAPAEARRHRRAAAQDETPLTPPTSLTKSRYKSEGDLTLAAPAPASARQAPATPERGLRDSDVFSRVSVKTLRASFCDLSQLREPAVPSPGRELTKAAGLSAALRSSFGKDDALSPDHTRIHVRSFDSSKAMRKFSKDAAEAAGSECRSCGRQVYQMESVHAEKAVWHKNCFRCSECSKQITVDTYASHEGRLYCVVHHRQLMKPRAPATPPHATDPGTRSPPAQGMVLETGEEAPAEVVRSSNKADYGLEDLQNLNVKDRFSVFERTNEDDQEKGLASVEVKRSQSILNKMKRFQERDSARDADSASGDESADSGDEHRRDPDLVRSTSKTRRERPISFSGLGDVKSRFEGGRREPTPDDKGEQTKLRGMICGAREHKLAYEEALREQEAQAESRRSLEDPSLVVQGNLRASYERAVQESGSPRPAAARDHEAVTRRRAADMASRFERGDVASAETDADADAPAVNENGGSHNGHSLAHDQSSAAGESALASLSSDAGGSELARGDSPDGQAVMEAPVADPELLHSDTTKRML